MPTAHPAQLIGSLAPTLSRWLWLVKWFLAIPHYIALFFLGIALVVTTVIAFFAILFTGRYPRGLFDFAVGVLRWGWRVGFYTYSALGTDEYPPFTLARTTYPADFDVEYPQQLSRGLVLVKWWLLAIPHYLLLGAISGGAASYTRTYNASGDGSDFVERTTSSAPGLLGLLVLIAALAVLFTAVYPRALFALIMGINRWSYRVSAYVLLLTDTYPPFRLDQGEAEPVPLVTEGG
jgi:hypothetical protein